ncbi:transposase [Streptomyces sp. SLBN-31]|uniref:transposase n=1 Tax=Streptomyces sp. SLBN-31 TaxID=2768444 RepID=UPI001154DEA7|nr:transposase [Streptomyces sp. SLBN-31]
MVWLDGQIAAPLVDDVGYRAIQEIGGIGPVPAAVFVAEIGDVTRFPVPKQLCSWAGLTPGHRSGMTHRQVPDTAPTRTELLVRADAVRQWTGTPPDPHPRRIWRIPWTVSVPAVSVSRPGMTSRRDSRTPPNVISLGSAMTSPMHGTRCQSTPEQA